MKGHLLFQLAAEPIALREQRKLLHETSDDVHFVPPTATVRFPSRLVLIRPATHPPGSLKPPGARASKRPAMRPCQQNSHSRQRGRIPRLHAEQAICASELPCPVSGKPSPRPERSIAPASRSTSPYTAVRCAQAPYARRSRASAGLRRTQSRHTGPPRPAATPCREPAHEPCRRSMQIRRRRIVNLLLHGHGRENRHAAIDLMQRRLQHGQHRLFFLRRPRQHHEAA